MTTRTASCSCGQLQIEVQGEPVRVSVCHCLACQRRTGSLFGEQARFPIPDARSPADQPSTFASGTKERSAPCASAPCAVSRSTTQQRGARIWSPYRSAPSQTPTFRPPPYRSTSPENTTGCNCPLSSSTYRRPSVTRADNYRDQVRSFMNLDSVQTDVQADVGQRHAL